MNIVKFPAINLVLNIKKVAFTLFGLEIYWYSVLIISAMIIALLIYKKRNGLYGIKFNDILDLVIYLIPISIVCARVYYVLFNLKYYMLNPIEIINTRNGGIAIYGGIIGGIITCIIFCKKRKINLLDLIDYIVPALALGQAIGRWGNFINIEAYGKKTSIFLRMGIYEAGKYIEVHPTFLYESITCLAIFVVLIILKNKRQFKGQIALIYLSIYSFERAIVEGLRIDSLMLGNVRVSQILSILILIFSITAYAVEKIKYKKCRKIV